LHARKVLICLFSYMTLLSSGYCAEDKPDTTEKITIFSEAYPPYTYTNSEGHVVGETADIISTIVEKTDISFEFRLLPWKRALSEHRRNPSSLIYPLTRNKYREKNYHWLVPFRTLKLYLYGLSTKYGVNHDINEGNPSFVCYSESSFCFVLEEHGIAKSSITRISSGKVNKQFDLLLRGRVDFVIETEVALDDFLQSKNIEPQAVVKLEKYQFNITDYLAANPNIDPLLISKFQDAVKIFQGQRRLELRK